MRLSYHRRPPSRQWPLLQGGWNLRSGRNERGARNTNYAFFGTAAATRRQFVSGFAGDVRAHYGEISSGEFQDAGAIIASRAKRPARVLSKSSYKHALPMLLSISIVKHFFM